MSEIAQLPRRRVLMRDPSLPHQIVIGYLPGSQHKIYVSCNCRLVHHPSGGSPGYEPLEVRGRWEAADALAVYHAHLPGGAS